MSRYLLLSDIHRRTETLRKILEAEAADRFDGVLIAGDTEVDPHQIADMIYRTFVLQPDVRVYMVCGNCDYGMYGLKDDLTIDTDEGHRIFLTHGHRYGVKSGNLMLAAVAGNNEADIAVYGHTHEPCDESVIGVRCINPGALGGYYSRGSYAVLEIDGGLIRVEHKQSDRAL